MKARCALLVCLLAGCRSAPVPWATAPLAPALHFVEAVPPRGLSVLVLDAHSGQPLPGAVLVLPGNAGVQTDSSGVGRLRALPLGRRQLEVLYLGYDRWRDTISVVDAAGLAIVAQLRRTRITLPLMVPAAAPP